METERRSSERLPIEIAINLTDGSSTQTLRACDIGERGMFIKTDAPPPLRRIVRIQIPTDEGDQDIQILAMVVHRATPEQAKRKNTFPGIGVRLYGLGQVARHQWQQFFQKLREKCPSATPKLPPPLILTGKGPPPIDAIKRRHVRYNLAMDVQCIGKNVEKGRVVDISLGGAFIIGIHNSQVGEPLSLILMHPKTGQGFDVKAKVARGDDARSKGGIAVVFNELEAKERDELEAFIHSALPVDTQIEDALTVIDPKDPMLA